MSDAFGRARPETQPASTPSRPTPSMLAYAFGERVAPPAGRVRGKLIPCSGRMVDGDELAVTLVHIALWDLERRELVKLEPPDASPAEGPVLVRPERRASPDDEMPGSLEDLLFRAARAGAGDRDVAGIVAELYERDVEDPFASIFELQTGAMLETRLMRRDVEGRVAPAPGAPPVPNQLVWLCENVARHIVGFATIEAEWRRYRAQDEAGFGRVDGAIRAAIESRRK